ncbi:hypothetical protein KY510_002995 [Listeria monocytogenes]|nr:hypothetical protein [Listeria monocytogenes]
MDEREMDKIFLVMIIGTVLFSLHAILSTVFIDESSLKLFNKMDLVGFTANFLASFHVSYLILTLGYKMGGGMKRIVYCLAMTILFLVGSAGMVQLGSVLGVIIGRGIGLVIIGITVLFTVVKHTE